MRKRLAIVILAASALLLSAPALAQIGFKKQLYPPASPGGELFWAADETWGAADKTDLDDSIGDTMNIIYTEKVDALDHWECRSQGDDGSNDWVNDNVCCWEPAYTHRVWMNKWCSGTLGSSTHSVGRPCTVSGDCGGSQACNSATWLYSESPDEVTITGHDFGSAGSMYTYPVRIVRGDDAAPVHGGSKNYPTCVPTMDDTHVSWLYVVDANTVVLYKDTDGDLVREVGTGSPPSGGTDTAYECTTATTDWQELLIQPVDPTTGDPLSHEFFASSNIMFQMQSSAGAEGVCVGGQQDGTACVLGSLWTASGCTMTSTVVGSLGACGAGNDGEYKKVTDGSTSTDCTVGGGDPAYTHVCQCENGTGWIFYGARVACQNDGDCYTGQTCSDGPCDDGGICMPYIYARQGEFLFYSGNLEAIDGSGTDTTYWGSLAGAVGARAGSATNVYNASLVDLYPGQCLAVLGYSSPAVQTDPAAGLDTYTSNGGNLIILDAE